MSNDTNDRFWKRQLRQGEQDLVDQIRTNVIQWVVRYVRDHPKESFDSVSALVAWLLRNLSSGTTQRPVTGKPPPNRSRTATTNPNVNSSPEVRCGVCEDDNTIYLYAKQPNPIDGWVLCSRGHYESRYIT
jgi:hypothetical protein